MKFYPKRGEVWWVEFDPQVGEEIKKIRPAIILNTEDTAFLPTRYVVPLRDFKDTHSDIYYFFPIDPNRMNGLKKLSSADCSQCKSVSLKRFSTQLGKISLQEIDEIANTVGMIIGCNLTVI